MAKITDGGITLFYGAKHECENIAAELRAMGVNLKVEDVK